MKFKNLAYIFAFFCIVGWGPFYWLETSSTALPILSSSLNYTPVNYRATSWLNDAIRRIDSQASNLNPNVLKLSLTAYLKARSEGLDKKELLTIIDYSRPSNHRRLWVVDLKTDKVLFNTWVAHGKNSGSVTATAFSNQPGSLESSMGVFETEDTYEGHNGYSLRVRGLERGINDNAWRRAIVFHGAWYANPNVAQRNGLLGRSWGCPAVSPTLAKPLINTIKDKTLVVAYYPDRHWLRSSSFLTG